MRAAWHTGAHRPHDNGHAPAGGAEVGTQHEHRARMCQCLRKHADGKPLCAAAVILWCAEIQLQTEQQRHGHTVALLKVSSDRRAACRCILPPAVSRSNKDKKPNRCQRAEDCIGRVRRRDRQHHAGNA